MVHRFPSSLLSPSSDSHRTFAGPSAMHGPSFLSLLSFEIPPRSSSIRPEVEKNHVDLRCSGSSVSSDVGVIPKRRGGRLLFPLPSFNEHLLMTHFRVSEGSYLAPSS